MKMISNILAFFTQRKTTFIIIGGVLIAFIIYNSFNTNYHNQEIRKLEKEIKTVEKLYQTSVKETLKLRDSISFYETKSTVLDSIINEQSTQITILRIEKNSALRKLRNVDSFIKERYANVEKAGTTFVVDRNDGKAIVNELVEKDYLVEEVQLLNIARDTLNTQISLLKTTLNFSKLESTQLDSLLKNRNEAFLLQQKQNILLKSDLRKAKRRSVWNTIKGIGMGTAAGIVIGTTLK